MPFTMTMPKLSPTMEAGTIAKWHKKVGEHVESGELLLEVSTDKATVEHQALDGGWLRKLIIPEGGEAIVNQPIAVFTEDKDESIEGYVPEGEAPKATSAPVAATPTTPQPQTLPTPQVQETVQPPPMTGGRIVASPLAKKLANEQGLDLSSLRGSGPGGRIMKRDLAKAKVSSRKSGQTTRLAMGSFEEEAMTPVRKVIAQRLQEAKATIPHFYLHQTIDAAQIVELREQLKKVDVKLTYNDMIIKASALALKQHPNVNSGYNKSGSIVRYKTIDVSVAVSIPGGLVTPIIRYADDKNIQEISDEVKVLSKRAKEGKLQPQEFQGGSFTISNLGMFGVTNFYAIINPPQAAILAVSGIQDVPVVKNGQIVPGKVMNISLSVDHRVIDGVAAAEFMQTLQRYLENPAAILL